MFRIIEKALPTQIEKEVWLGSVCIALTEPPISLIESNQTIIDEAFADTDNTKTLSAFRDKICPVLKALWGIDSEMTKDMTGSQLLEIFEALPELNVFPTDTGEQKNDQVP